MPETHIEIRPRRQFREFLQSEKRWDCLVVHRRGGKTYSSLQKLLYRALRHQRPGPPKRYAYIAPTRDQAKDIAWGYLKAFTSKIPGVVTNESDLMVKFPCGMTIRLYSGENYERMRGLYFDGVVIDEPEDIDPLAWPRVIRPCLTDYKGWAIWIGTVKGKKGQWARLTNAMNNPEWFSLLLKASDSGIIPQDELDDIRHGTDEDSFQQEYECNPNIGIPGVLFAKFMSDAEAGGRIFNFEWDRSEPVWTFWDLGSPTNTRCTYIQFVGREIHVIDHDADLNDPELTPGKRVAMMKAKGCNLAGHFFPHDAAAKEKIGKNFQQVMTEAGLTNIAIIPRCVEIWPGINKLAELLPRMLFHRDNCDYLIQSMEGYRRKIDKDGTVMDKIHEDWTCHSVDTLRMLAEAMLNGMLKGHSEVIREFRPKHMRQKTSSRGRYTRR